MAILAPAAVALTTGSLPLYACPAGVRQIVEVIVVNVNASNPATATLNWTDNSAANASATFVFTDVAAKDSIMSPRKVLEPSDTLTGLASAVGYLIAHVNVVYEEPIA